MNVGSSQCRGANYQLRSSGDKQKKEDPLKSGSFFMLEYLIGVLLSFFCIFIGVLLSFVLGLLLWIWRFVILLKTNCFRSVITP